MHFAKLENSPRLQRVYRVLRKGRKVSTFQIMKATGFRNCAVHSDISELRANGIDVKREQRGKLHYYWVTK